MLEQQILKQQQRNQQEINFLQEQLATFPKGNLVCCHHNNSNKWYRSIGGTRKYIPKSNRQLAEQLACKKYYTCRLKELQQEQDAIASYLNKHLPASEHPSQKLLQIPGYQELLNSFFKPLSSELYDWANAPYEQNPKNPENLIHKTISGHLVRSKSEAMIAHLLYINKIPYHYEEILRLDKTILFPDFTIRHPVTGETYHWEHFGLMDDPAYCKNTAAKIQLYSLHGIIPTIQLITTYETQKNPLSTEQIQKIIEGYFL